VNTLYAGDSARGAHEQWDEVAQAGGGRFTAISMTDGLAQVATPHDDEIQRLNDALNQTYVPYGAEGRLKQERQVQQDANARIMGLGSATTRALAKGTRMYKNSGWDLVDAVEDGADLEAIPEAALPAELQAMEPDARKAYVDQQAQEREAIREKLKQAKRSRDAWLDENAEQGEGLGAKMKEMVAEQL